MRCCFVGHRDIFGAKDLVYAEVRRLMEFGVTEFYSGGMGNFDKICEEAVRDLEEKYTLDYAVKRNKIIINLYKNK